MCAWETGLQKPRKNTLVSNKEILEKKGFLDEREAKLLFYQFLRNNISFSASLLMGIDLFPFQHIGINSMLKSDYSLCVWSRGLSKCAKFDSLVSTDKGIKQIIDVDVGDKILAKDDYCLVEDKVINQEDVTYKITSRRGYESEGLDYHRVLVLTPNLDMEWKFAKDVKVGEFLVMKKGGLFFDQINIFNGFINVLSNKDTVSQEINLTNVSLLDWYYFFGLVIGDGYLTHNFVKITNQDPEIGEFMKSFAERLGANLTIRAYDNKPHVFDFCINSVHLTKFLVHCGFVFGKLAHEKIIPFRLLKCSEENACAILRGLYDCDGSAVERKGKKKELIISFANSSYELIKQIRLILLNLGITTQTKISSKAQLKWINGKQYPCKTIWALNCFARSQSLRFFDKVGFLIKRKQNRRAYLEDKQHFNIDNDPIPYVSKFLLEKEGKIRIHNKNTRQWLTLGKSLTTNKGLLKSLLPYISEQSSFKIKPLLRDDFFFDEVKSVEQTFSVTVDLQVKGEHCYMSDGFINHNSFSAGICAGLDAMFSQGINIGILSSSYRQSKMIFKKIEDIAAKPEAYLFRQAISKIRHSNDCWELEIGRSRITALPLGDGEKLRGYRFNRIYIDEFLLMPERVITEILSPFLAVVQEPQKRKEIYDLESKLIARGEMKEEDRHQFESNKLIALSSASYKFEYLYKLYQQYENLILNPKPDNNAKRCIIQLSYDCAPDHLYDQNQIDQAKATMSEAQFQREYGAQFTSESDGFFSQSKISACTVPDGETPSVEAQGDPNEEYIVSVDPSWAETSTSDDFAIQILKINKEKQITTLVHSYAIPGGALKEHISYFYYIISNFNVVAMCFDYSGGLTFMKACNESELFKFNKIELKIIEVEFDKPEDYNANLISAKNEYNKSNHKTVFMRKATSAWIRVANEQLQSALDHKRIFFASPALDGQFRLQTMKNIDIFDLKYRRKTAEEESLDEVDWEEGAKRTSSMIDFLEHIHDMIRLTKTQLTMIVPTTSVQGTQSFDLPKNLKGSGRDRARKDSYSALVLGNWISKIYFDMQTINVEETDSTFTPMMI